MSRVTITGLFDNSGMPRMRAATSKPSAFRGMTSACSPMVRSTLSGTTTARMPRPVAGTGAGIGTVLGGGAGLLTGLGIMAVPGVGPIVAAGSAGSWRVRRPEPWPAAPPGG